MYKRIFLLHVSTTVHVQYAGDDSVDIPFILKEDVEINPSEVPDYVIPNTEKLEIEKLRKS